MKKLYRKILKKLQNLIIKIEISKTYIFEIIAIYKKRKLYRNIKWTKEQQKEFDDYWKENYGKKISNRWHKLYQSINGTFNIEYIPEILYSTKFEYKLNDYYKAKIFSDKGFYDILFKSEQSNDWRLPETYLVKYGDTIYDSKRNIITKEEAKEIIKNIKECVIKPIIDSSSGNGVKLLKQSKEILYNFCENIEYKYCILQEKVEQSEELAKLNSSSINTFRVITYMCDTKIELAPIVLRIGSNNSFLDNIHAGGMCIHVKENGKLEKEAYILGWGDNNKKIKSHPDTQIIFEDYKISSMDKIIRVAKELHSKVIGIKFISWDLSIDNNNKVVLIEANMTGQSIWFPQIVSKKTIFDENIKTMLNLFKARK